MRSSSGPSREIAKDASTIAVWQPILAKYPPTLIGQCEKAVKWAEELATEWLKTGMFAAGVAPSDAAAKVVKELSDHSSTLAHARHIAISKCKEIGLNVVPLESDQALQEAVLSVHHCCIQTLSSTPAYKIIENHDGRAFIQLARQVTVQM